MVQRVKEQKIKLSSKQIVGAMKETDYSWNNRGSYFRIGSLREAPPTETKRRTYPFVEQ